MEAYIYETHNQNVSSNSSYLPPSRVQTKIEEISLPASLTYPKRRYIMIGFFILGSGVSFNFQIGEYKDFTELSKVLWEKNKDHFIEAGAINELNLKLWNVEISTRNNEKYSKLKMDPRVDIDINQEFGGEEIDQTWLISRTFPITPSAEHIHIIVQPLKLATAATGKKRLADPESVGTEPKRKKDTPTFENLIVDLGKKILFDKPPELYPITNVAGRFHKRDIPISSGNYVDMRLDVETTNTGRELIDNLKNETNASCYLLYAVSGAGKTRAIFDMSMNENGIYVVYVECRPSSDNSNWNSEPTMDRNFAQLVASIDSVFGSYNDNIGNPARIEAKRLIILEFTARILYLIFLKTKFPDITPRDFLLSQLNSGQKCITSIKDSLTPIGYTFNELQIIIRSALRYLKDKLPGQQSLIFAIDESNVASNKLFNGYFLNTNNHPRGLLTPMIEILRLFEIPIVIAGTSFSLKRGSDVQSDIGKGNKAKYIINFNTIDSKDVKAYIMRYLDLSNCDIDKIKDSKYLVGRPRIVARLVKEIIDTENLQKSKQIVLENAVNRTVQSIRNDMTRHLEAIVNEAYEKEDLRNKKLQEILMTLFINCWFFRGYVSKCEVDDYSARIIDCGIASLKSENDSKFLMVKEPLAIETVNNVLSLKYNRLTDALLEKLLEELRKSAAHFDNSNISKGIVWQYFVIARLMDFRNKTVFEFVNEIYDSNQPDLPEWTKEAVINIESYGNSQIFFRFDSTLKDDVDVIEKFLNTSTYSEYMLIPAQIMRPDGIYIGKRDRDTYWTLLISAKMYNDNLSGEGINDDKRSTDWSLLYHQKNEKVNKNCENLKKRLDNVREPFTHQGSLRIHYILPGVARERISNQSKQSNRGGCYIEGNDVIMYIDKTLLERYFPEEYVVSLKNILTRN